jgi:hypothetical protein
MNRARNKVIDQIVSKIGARSSDDDLHPILCYLTGSMTLPGDAADAYDKLATSRFSKDAANPHDICPGCDRCGIFSTPDEIAKRRKEKWRKLRRQVLNAVYFHLGGVRKAGNNIDQVLESIGRGEKGPRDLVLRNAMATVVRPKSTVSTPDLVTHLIYKRGLNRIRASRFYKKNRTRILQDRLNKRIDKYLAHA